MSRHASCLRSPGAGLLVGVLAMLASGAGAQTIADYSRAQRALLENTMTQAAARSASLGASAPVPVQTAAASTASLPPMSAPHPPLPPVAPVVQVSGVFASGGGAIAEVIVNATPYLLGAGQGVPGTAWHVESIAVDRVVLSRRAGVVAATDAEAARKVFPLPALR